MNLVNEYREAIRMYHKPHVANAAATLGMSQRDYCEHYLTLRRMSRFQSIIYSDHTTLHTVIDPDAAYREALELEGVVL